MMLREDYLSTDPTAVSTFTVETDTTLPETQVEIDGYVACLDASQVGAVVRQLTTWLAERAR